MENFNPSQEMYCQSDCEIASKCLDCVQQDMAASKEGVLLANNPPRYAKWHFEDVGLFRVVMGEDVDPLLHGIYQAKNVALPMIEMQNQMDGRRRRRFSKEEAKLLLLTHVLHDYHEGITGDIAADDKTSDINRNELRVNQQLVARLYNLEADHPFLLKMWETMDETGFDENGDSFVNRAFHAGEQCGYFLTGIKAWSLREHKSLTSEEQAKCKDMGIKVASAAARHLLDNMSDFKYCDYLLGAHAVALGEIEDGMDSR